MPIKIHEMVIRVNLKEGMTSKKKAQRENIGIERDSNSNFKGTDKICEKKNER